MEGARPLDLEPKACGTNCWTSVPACERLRYWLDSTGWATDAAPTAIVVTLSCTAGSSNRDHPSMEIPLDLPPDRQNEFLDQLNAELRAVSSSYSGSAGFLPDRSFEASITADLMLDAGPVPVTWTVHKDPKGTLKTVSFLPATVDAPPPEWGPKARDVVTRALTATVAVRRRTFFRRLAFRYFGRLLDGEYWLPGFRLAPALPDDDHPGARHLERYVNIDMQLQAIDDLHATALAHERARRHAARLSLILNVGLSNEPHEWVWVRSEGQEAETLGSSRRQRGFVHPPRHRTNMPAKGEECSLGRYSGDLMRNAHAGTGPLTCPPETRRLLRGADSRDYPVGEAFDACARLYHVALVAGRHFPSVALSYVVAAAEAASSSDVSYDGFSGFMRAHAESHPDIDALLDVLYGKIRSAHFHGGSFPLGDYSPFGIANPLPDQKHVEASGIQTTGFRLVRAAIVNWCLSNVAEPDEP